MSVYGQGSFGKVKRKNAKGVVYEYWRYQIQIDGKKKEFYGKTKKEALDKYKAFELRDEKDDKSGEVTLTLAMVAREAFDIKKGTGIKQTTQDFYEFGVIALEKAKVGQLQVQAITSENIRDYVTDLVSAKNSLATIKRQKAVLKMAFDYAIKKKFVTENPMDEVSWAVKNQVLKKERKSVILTTEQRKRLEYLVELPNQKCEKFVRTGEDRYGVNGMAIVFLLHTGLRFGELRALEWKHVKLKPGSGKKPYIIIEQNAPTSLKGEITTTKSVDSNRKVGLDKKSVEILKRLEKDKKKPTDAKNPDLVFRTESGSMLYRNNVERTLGGILRRNPGDGIESLYDALMDEFGDTPTLHDLRHTYASELIRNGAKPKSVQKVLGHKDVKITLNIYAQVFDEEAVDETVDLIESD